MEECPFSEMPTGPDISYSAPAWASMHRSFACAPPRADVLSALRAKANHGVSDTPENVADYYSRIKERLSGPIPSPEP